MAATDPQGGTQATGLAPDLPFETIPTYPMLKLFARSGKVIAGAVAAAAVVVGIWAAQALGTWALAAAGVVAGAFLGLVLLVLADLTRALSDIMLPR